MGTLDKHGVRSAVGAGQIRDCQYRNMGLTENCSQIICKNDASKPTGLNCLVYHPTEVPLKEAPKK